MLIEYSVSQNLFSTLWNVRKLVSTLQSLHTVITITFRCAIHNYIQIERFFSINNKTLNTTQNIRNFHKTTIKQGITQLIWTLQPFETLWSSRSAVFAEINCILPETHSFSARRALCPVKCHRFNKRNKLCPISFWNFAKCCAKLMCYCRVRESTARESEFGALLQMRFGRWKCIVW